MKISIDKHKGLVVSLIVLSILCTSLCISTFALAYTVINLDDNRIQTGGIKIDLNDGRPVITEGEFLFEPGMNVEKDFYIQNNGTWAVYYKLYFSEVYGDLGDVLEVTIFDQAGNALITGKLAELTQTNTPAIEDSLEVDERRNLTIRFHFPEEAGNIVQDGSLTFEFSAVAVQTKNNPRKEF